MLLHLCTELLLDVGVLLFVFLDSQKLLSRLNKQVIGNQIKSGQLKKYARVDLSVLRVNDHEEWKVRHDLQRIDQTPKHS